MASGEVDGYVSPVTKADVLNVGSRVGFRASDVRASLVRLEELGVETVDPTDCWETAALLKEAHGTSLGDSYALATAEAVDGTLLVGADDDFDAVPGVVERVRDEPA